MDDGNDDDRVVQALVCLGLFIIFLASLSGPILELRERMDFEAWPLIDATIVESHWEVREERVPRARRPDFRAVDALISQRKIRIAYHYTFEGQIYTGTKLRPDPNDTRFPPDVKIRISEEIPGYPVDAVVKAHVNPRNPHEAYLEGPYDRFDYSRFLWPSLLLIILLILIPGLFGCELTFRKEEAPS